VSSKFLRLIRVKFSELLLLARVLVLAIKEFVQYYNDHHHHEAANNLILADIFYGRREKMMTHREFLKEQTHQFRRIYNNHNPVDEITLDYENCIS
jgi:hypothetical protein